ncbi:MAG: hypothetical protein WBC88_10785 [Candidatus Zixiibacteriota bacterium]
MKKYLILGTVVLALAAVCLFFSWESAPTADHPTAFYGTATNGRQIWAHQQQFPFNSYSDYAQFEHYSISIPSIQTGTYLITDGCQTFYGYWNGSNSSEIDICVDRPGEPGYPDCPCF